MLPSGVCSAFEAVSLSCALANARLLGQDTAPDLGYRQRRGRSQSPGSRIYTPRPGSDATTSYLVGCLGELDRTQIDYARLTSGGSNSAAEHRSSITAPLTTDRQIMRPAVRCGRDLSPGIVDSRRRLFHGRPRTGRGSTQSIIMSPGRMRPEGPGKAGCPCPCPCPPPATGPVTRTEGPEPEPLKPHSTKAPANPAAAIRVTGPGSHQTNGSRISCTPDALAFLADAGKAVHDRRPRCGSPLRRGWMRPCCHRRAKYSTLMAG
jgi:hypothetical protein